MRPRRCRLPALPALTVLWCVVLTGVTPAIAAEPLPGKVVILTFDEGNTSDLRTVVPILKKHGFGATFFITSGWLGSKGGLTWSDVKELQQSGFEIGCDTGTDPNRTAVHSAALIHARICCNDGRFVRHSGSMPTQVNDGTCARLRINRPAPFLLLRRGSWTLQCDFVPDRSDTRL